VWKASRLVHVYVELMQVVADQASYQKSRLNCHGLSLQRQAAPAIASEAGWKKPAAGVVGASGSEARKTEHDMSEQRRARLSRGYLPRDTTPGPRHGDCVQCV
jgi:hypothetical protein